MIYHTMHQELPTMNLFTKSLFLKRSLKFLVSVSVLFFSYSSWLPYFDTLNLYFSTFALHLLNYSTAVDRSYMFLLCNGILVFLGLIGSSSFKTDVQGEYPYMNHVVDKDIEVQRVTTLENDFLQDGSEVGNEFMIIEGPKEEENQAPKEEEIRFFITDEVAYDQEELEGNAWTELLDTTGEHNKRLYDGYYTDEVGDGLLSTEELNKKFEDFIRKMKENIITEAQQHLIMVS